MTFETAMKHAMDEALFPHGFQRVKGRRPYYVRMIGDESRIIPGETYAIIGHNVSMEEEIEHAIGILKQIVLPKMDTMVTLKDCIENARSKILYSEESVFGGNGDADNEGFTKENR